MARFRSLVVNHDMGPVRTRWFWQGTVLNLVVSVPALEPYSPRRYKEPKPDEPPKRKAPWTKRYAWWLMDYMGRDMTRCEDALRTHSSRARLHIVVSGDLADWVDSPVKK